MERLVDENRYAFTAATGAQACCGLRIVREENHVVVILTELPDNPGMSVTNAAEEIATQVRRAFGLDPDQTRWIEHYPERQYHVHGVTLHEPATYEEICFTWEGYEAMDPRWQPLTPAEVEIFLGVGEA